MNLRSVVLSLGILVAAPLLSLPSAEASVSITMMFDDLVQSADAVAILSPLDSTSVWEGGRIITYTRLKVEEPVAGSTDSEVTIRTLGGSVENIGQSVSGEPVFAKGARTLAFLKQDAQKKYVVVGRGQGLYPVVKDEKTQRTILGRSDAGMLLPPLKTAQQAAPLVVKPSRFAGTAARDALLFRPVDEATRDIREAWQRAHAK